MKVGDLVKTKVSLLDNRVPIGKLGMIVKKNGNENRILKVKFMDKSELFCYPEHQLELISAG